MNTNKNENDIGTATEKVKVINAYEITPGTQFRYGSHDYIAAAVETANGITSVNLTGSNYPMEFYPYSRVFSL